MLLLLLLLFPLVSFAAISDEDYLKRNLDSIKRDESVAIKNELGKLTEWKFKDLEEVEKFVYGINPELVESVKSMSDVEKSAEYKSWLAQKTYEDFFDKYLQELRSYSEKLGKKIKYTKVGKKGKKITLKKFDEKIDDFDDENDGGVRSFSLSTDDLKDCHKIITTKREKVCYEPDGYIRYQIDYKDTDVATKNIKTFTVSKDVPEENRSSYYYFKLESQDRKIVLSDGSVRLLRGYDLSFNAVDQEYDKMLKYRNYLVEDLLNGMCRVVCKKCFIKGKKSTLIDCDTDAKKYKSNIIPGFIGIDFVESYNLDTKFSEQDGEQDDEIY